MITKEQFEQELKKEQLSLQTFYEMYLDLRDSSKELITFDNFQSAFQLYFQLSTLKNKIIENAINHFKKKFNINE